ncbi:acyl-CoA dehydrogenase family protein [Saccharopolyspora sp. MS10]|uniref:acyl-CoA dehydrogenase family protein n=1 Tax=Saccharopolyspora sp. MS10 TaxID=3385973 RepID=UPI0039A308A5
MRFARTTEQQDVAETLRALLDAAGTAEIARAWARGDPEPWRAVWARLAGMGACGVVVPEHQGGQGLGAVELAVCLEELGYAGLPGPVVESLAAVPALLADAGQPWPAELAAGRVVASVAFPGPVPLALDATAADVVFRCADGVAVVARPTGEPERSLDPTRALRAVAPAGPPIPGARVAAAFDAGVLGCAAQLLGIGRRLLDLALRHVRERHQFGRPIGSFQAVKHALADVALRLEFARPLVRGACLALDSGAEHADRDVSVAKTASAEAARLAARTALQVHGAIGYTAEHDLHLWLLKAAALNSAWGNDRFHRHRIAAALAAGRTAPIGP